MQLPLNFSSFTSSSVYKLLKSLYCLKQISRQWYSKLSYELLNQGFQQASSNFSLFTKSSSGSFLALLIYVDDIILVKDDQAQKTQTKICLHKAFQIKDLGSLKFYLGLKVTRSNRKFIYLRKIYSRTIKRNMLFCKVN